MEPDNRAVLDGQIRAALSAIAGAAVTGGLISESVGAVSIGILSYLIPAAWSWVSNKKKADKTQALVIAAQSEQREVLTPDQRDVVRKAIDEGQG